MIISIILILAGYAFMASILRRMTAMIDQLTNDHWLTQEQFLRFKNEQQKHSSDMNKTIENLLKFNGTSRQRLSNKIELLESEIREIHNLIGTAPGQPLSPKEVRDLFRKAINEDGNVESLESRKRIRPRSPKRPKSVPNQDLPPSP